MQKIFSARYYQFYLVFIFFIFFSSLDSLPKEYSALKKKAEQNSKLLSEAIKNNDIAKVDSIFKKIPLKLLEPKIREEYSIFLVDNNLFKENSEFYRYFRKIEPKNSGRLKPYFFISEFKNNKDKNNYSSLVEQDLVIIFLYFLKKDDFLSISNFYEKIPNKDDFRDIFNQFSAIYHYKLKNYQKCRELILKINRKIPDISVIIDQIKINLAVYYLKKEKFSTSKKIIDSLTFSKNKNFLKSLYYKILNEDKNAFKYLEKIDLEYLLEKDIRSQLAADLYYKNKQFDLSTKLYKNIKKSSKYKNYAIGYCYKNLYKFNSSAYYWLKNLTPQKNYYDSIATADLANLYSYTKHDDISFKYFDLHINRYKFLRKEKFYKRYIKLLIKFDNFNKLNEFYNDFNTKINEETYYLINKYLADFYFKEEKFVLAKFHYLNQLSIKEDLDSIYNYQKCRFELDEFFSAEEYILFLLKNFENHPDTHQNKVDLMSFYLNTNRLDDAEKFYNTFNDSTETLEFLSIKILSRKNKTEKAIKALLTLFRNSKNPELTEKISLDLSKNLTRIKFQKAFDYLDIKIDSFDSIKSKSFIQINARLFEHAKEYQHAIDTYKTINSFPDSTKNSFYIAKNYFMKEEYENSLKFLSKINEKDLELFKKKFQLQLEIYQATNDENACKNLRLEYYLHFPKDYENIEFLAIYFQENEQFLFSYYFFKKIVNPKTMTFDLKKIQKNKEILLQIDDFFKDIIFIEKQN